MSLTKQKGNIAEAKVLTYLISQGFGVFVPWGEDNRYDLVCDIFGTLQRIQVKYVSPKNNCIEIPLRSCNNWNNIKYNKESVDIIAAYNPSDDKIYFIKLSDFKNTATVKLRFGNTKNCQKQFVRWAKDFENLKAFGPM